MGPGPPNFIQLNLICKKPIFEPASLRACEPASLRNEITEKKNIGNRENIL